MQKNVGGSGGDDAWPQRKKIPLSRSSQPEVFLGKGVLKISSKFTGEHSCQSAISLYWSHTLAEVFSGKYAAYFQNIFS